MKCKIPFCVNSGLKNKKYWQGMCLLCYLDTKGTITNRDEKQLDKIRNTIIEIQNIGDVRQKHGKRNNNIR